MCEASSSRASTLCLLPHQQTGGLCLLKHENGDEMVCNVEYNQLEDVISHTIDPRGDFADETGYSPCGLERVVTCRFPGNCNNLCMNINEYLKVITMSHGIVPEFVNPKYKVRAEMLHDT